MNGTHLRTVVVPGEEMALSQVTRVNFSANDESVFYLGI